MIGEDFLDKPYEVQGEGILAANKPPGFVLMVHMMNESGMLKMVGIFNYLRRLYSHFLGQPCVFFVDRLNLGFLGSFGILCM